MWAWVDALFMSGLFRLGGAQSFMPEAAAIGISFAGVPICAVLFWKSDAVRSLIVRPRVQVGTGFIGVAGSALVALSGSTGDWLALGAGIALCALFMSIAIASWGAVYCRRGAKSAMVYVSGGFGCALVINLLLLAMIPVASVAIASLLPLLASVTLLAIREDDRTYAPCRSACSQTASRDAGDEERGGLVSRIGVTPMTLCGLMLIMVGLGYMQHLVSFSNLIAAGMTAGVTIQIVRGTVAALLFVAVLVAPDRTSAIYRIGLLAIVAGFSLMPFLAGTDYFWISGAVIIGGYVIFDVFIWVIVSQASFIRKCDPLRTVLVMRQMVNGSCMAIGIAAGMWLSTIAPASAFKNPEAIFIGYLMTVAIVLLMGSKDTWELFDAKPAIAADGNPKDGLQERLQRLGERWGLTQREYDIFELLAAGRTQPWIAESLGIAESTVNSHVRHIYQKADVNSKQELLDHVLPAPKAT